MPNAGVAIENLSTNIVRDSVLQESLQHAIKHSGVRKFEVSLRCISNELQLAVLDSGVGFNPEQINEGLGLGLTSMRERVRLIHGQLLINTKPQCGTRIHARVPDRLCTAATKSTSF
jgi:signal transduction histidine kinase